MHKTVVFGSVIIDVYRLAEMAIQSTCVYSAMALVTN